MIYRTPWQPPEPPREPKRSLVGATMLFVMLALAMGVLVFVLAPKGGIGSVFSAEPWFSATDYVRCGHPAPPLAAPDPPPEKDQPPSGFQCNESFEILQDVECNEAKLISKKVRNPRKPGRCFACMISFGSGIHRPTMLEGDERLRLPSEVVSKNIEGLVLVKCTLTERGTVTNCKFIKTLPYVEDGVLANLAARKYEPVGSPDKPIAVDYTFSFRIHPEECEPEDPYAF